MQQTLSSISRRDFSLAVAGSIIATNVSDAALQPDKSTFRLRYMLGSCMYGYTALQEIAPEVRKIGAQAIDIWPRVHGNQREQLDEMGEEAFADMLREHNIRLGCLTQYKLGPFGLADEIPLAKRLGCSTIVTGGRGPKGLKGQELRLAVQTFVERMKPHLAIAQAHNVTIAIENHGSNLFESADALKWMVELCPDTHLGVALAPYHLPQDEQHIADLIRSLGSRLEVFYAWQHGMGCRLKLPKEQELLQMPGRGSLDFQPLLAALKHIDYQGWTEIFMHPVPRGIPILDTTSAVTAEINQARQYLSECLNAG
ncbi:MAG: sugar phosphate isomerase/epimerase [Fuerstiella sp.]|nr:sugar phosphate isomerase/epimerase [Fuerstiella sp.]